MRGWWHYLVGKLVILKHKGSKFQTFVHGILPLEAELLLQNHRFQDAKKRSILQSIANNVSANTQIDDSDIQVDKRKYSFVKKWSETQLKSLDVDEKLQYLLQLEYKILSDSITLNEEKSLLKTIDQTLSSDFNFIKIYDIARTYRHYLQIRLRYNAFAQVHEFLQKYRIDYEFSKLVNDKLQEVTTDIIVDYQLKTKEKFAEVIPWLSTLFYNDALDGYNRLLAWIRIIFIAHNQRDYSLLMPMFEHFESLIRNGTLYSHRILTNFYSQCLLYYASIPDFTKAAHYGYLSIKQKNNDYLYYLNNLAAVLLRAKRPSESLHILMEASKDAKYTLNFHNKIGCAAYMMFALIDTGAASKAENHGFVFLTAFKKEILEFRWHLFFTAYLKAMLVNRNYSGVLKISATLKLLQRDEKYKKSANYSPALPWMILLAQYKMGNIERSLLDKQLSILEAAFAPKLQLNATKDELVALTKVILNLKK